MREPISLGKRSAARRPGRSPASIARRAQPNALHAAALATDPLAASRRRTTQRQRRSNVRRTRWSPRAPYVAAQRAPRAASRRRTASARAHAAASERRAPRPPPQRRPAATARRRRTAASGTIDAFELFCAYHLGITPDGGYRIQNIHEVARRFGTNAGELRQVLADLRHGRRRHRAQRLRSRRARRSTSWSRPKASAVASWRGRSTTSSARTPKQTRNWAREMEDAQRQIDETIGRDGRWSPTPRDPAGKQS